MSPSRDRIPDYLRTYVVDQAPAQYTPEEHASWRFIMRQAQDFFATHFVGDYQEGLKKTGITTERIPSVEEMDKALQDLGWGAVPVRGFIPPGAFLDFQARRILPIAADMRTVTNIAYTPAPDIVHEAAGHAPILIDKDYAKYLTAYAAMAQKALFCQEDLDLYEAIRRLSDLKENPDSTPAEIEAAEQGLKDAVAAVPFVSEAAKVARMNWWTVEYGLAGDVDNPKIFGAGLMSSVGESRNCLKDDVRKIPLTVDCIETSYDITRPQPQLFVTKNTAHLVKVLRDLERTLAYKKGGAYGVNEAMRCRTVASVCFNSGASISGKVVAAEFNTEFEDTLDFIKFDGPVQLAHRGIELDGQGVAQHPHGFSSPLGNWEAFPGQNPAKLTAADLDKAGLKEGQRCELKFANGFHVTGKLLAREFSDDLLVVLKWDDCSITRGGKTYYEPEWGNCDMLVSDGVVPSVHGGAADRALYGSHDLGKATTQPGRSTPFTNEEKVRFAKFEEVKKLRDELKKAKSTELSTKAKTLLSDIEDNFADQWLLRLEAWELGVLALDGEAITQKDLDAIEQSILQSVTSLDTQTQTMVKEGIRLVKKIP